MIRAFLRLVSYRYLANQIGWLPDPNGFDKKANDYDIQWIRIWQKTSDLFNWYFVNDCLDNYAGINTGVPFQPAGFYASSTAKYDYHIETDYYVGATYKWTSSDPNLIIDPNINGWEPSDERKSKCYFHYDGTAPTRDTTFYIYLTATTPLYRDTIRRTISITILPKATIAAPTSVYISNPDDCNYSYCVDPIAGATGYQWSFYSFFPDTSYANTTGPCFGNFNPYEDPIHPASVWPFPPGTVLPIYVRSILDVTGCGDQNVFSSITEYTGGTTGVTCPPRLEDTSKAISSKNNGSDNLIKAYPSRQMAIYG